METFKEAWVAIDSESKGNIQTSEFVEYLQKNGHDDVFIDKWRQVFDPEESGSITIETYSEVLDIRPEEIRESKESKSLPKDVQYVSGDMSLEWQQKVVKITKEALSQQNLKLSDLSKRIKTNLESAYGPLWHVLIAFGQYSCYFGFQPGYSFIFKIGKQAFIVYKTPQT